MAPPPVTKGEQFLERIGTTQLQNAADLEGNSQGLRITTIKRGCVKGWLASLHQFSLWRFRSESPPNLAPCSSINQSKSGENPSTPTGILHESESKLPLLRKSRATQGHPQATPKPVDSQLIGTPKPPQGHPKATPRLPQGYPKATSKLGLGNQLFSLDFGHNENCWASLPTKLPNGYYFDPPPRPTRAQVLG
jgi:hypothetical protein